MDHQFYPNRFVLLSYSRKIISQSPISISSTPPEMGQAWANLESSFKSKTPEEKVRALIDRVFDRVIEDAKKRANDSSSLPQQKSSLVFDEMHSAIVQVFRELNNIIPGANYKPPSHEEVEEMLKAFDTNLDNQVDRQEFSEFVQKYTVDLVWIDVNELQLMSVAVPAIALLIKWASNLIAKVPTIVFVTTVTFAAVLLYSIFKKQTIS